MAENFLCGVMAIQKDQEPNWSAAEDHLRNLTSDEVKKLAEEYSSEFTDEDAEDFESEFNESETRDALCKAFTEIRDAWNGESVVYSRFDIQNLTLLITGNRTWGDGVEEINYMVLFEASGAHTAAGFLNE